MKKALLTSIVSHIDYAESANAVEISEYLKMPIGRLVEYLFALVQQGVLDFDSETYRFTLGNRANTVVLNKNSASDRIKLEPFQPSLLYSRISSCEELNRYLRLDDYNFAGANSYHTFRIMGKKRERLSPRNATTKWRDIAAPSMELKIRQRWILDNILSVYTPLECVHGFVTGKTIKTNALCHINQEEIGCIDIKDFFPSIGYEQVKNAFLSLNYDVEISEQLAKLTTYKGRLPQGAPTSPMLSNIIMKPIDLEIMDYAKENSLVYSRYADDITISGLKNISMHLRRVTEIIEKNGFAVNEKKTRVMNSASGKKVTGLSVGKSVKVPQQFKRKLRQEIYYCSKYGVESHLRKGQNPDDRSINFMGYLYGKAYFVKMVEPAIGARYLNQLNYLFGCEEYED